MRKYPLGSDNARLQQTLPLTYSNLDSAGLVELAPALYRNTSLKVLDMLYSLLNDVECA
jgi:hypothetical protein